MQESGFTKINSGGVKPIITHHVAHNPPHLNIRVLPDEYKKELTQKFDDFVEWSKNYDKKYQIAAIGIKNGVCKYMNSSSYYDTHWNEFKQYTTDLDRIRNEQINTIVPNLAKYME
jgi:hypothetical protein